MVSFIHNGSELQLGWGIASKPKTQKFINLLTEMFYGFSAKVYYLLAGYTSHVSLFLLISDKN